MAPTISRVGDSTSKGQGKGICVVIELYSYLAQVSVDPDWRNEAQRWIRIQHTPLLPNPLSSLPPSPPHSTYCPPCYTPLTCACIPVLAGVWSLLAHRTSCSPLAVVHVSFCSRWKAPYAPGPERSYLQCQEPTGLDHSCRISVSQFRQQFRTPLWCYIF